MVQNLQPNSNYPKSPLNWITNPPKTKPKIIAEKNYTAGSEKRRFNFSHSTVKRKEQKKLTHSIDAVRDLLH